MTQIQFGMYFFVTIGILWLLGASFQGYRESRKMAWKRPLFVLTMWIISLILISCSLAAGAGAVKLGLGILAFPFMALCVIAFVCSIVPFYLSAFSFDMTHHEVEGWLRDLCTRDTYRLSN